MYIYRLNQDPQNQKTMRSFLKAGLPLMAVFLLQVCSVPAPQKTVADVFIDGRKHILLIHPTVNNLKTFYYLTEEGIFTLPDDYRVVGIYPEKGSYDYSLSQAHIREEGIEDIALWGLGSELNQQNLFGENGLSEVFAELFSKSEGAVFFGGPDIPPATYGEQTDLLTVITDPHRHHLELSFLFHLLGGHQNPGQVPLLEDNPHYRILGICLGMQSMNVATGGTLTQDIPTTIYGTTTVEGVLSMEPDQQHRNYQTHYSADGQISHYIYHMVRFEPGSQLAALLPGTDATPFVMSAHHQSADRIGKGFRVTAWSMDGNIAEAIEHTRYPNVIGVQFHPELRFIYEPATRIGFEPATAATHSYLDMFPGEMGGDFHYDFWNHIGVLYP